MATEIIVQWVCKECGQVSQPLRKPKEFISGLEGGYLDPEGWYVYRKIDNGQIFATHRFCCKEHRDLWIQQNTPRFLSNAH